MYTPEEIVETYEMISLQHLNIRTITVGINLLGCLDKDLQRLKSRIYRKVVETALRLNNAVREVEAKYGVEIVNRRIAVTPIAILLEPFAEEGDATKIGLELATALDDAAEEGGIDYIGGYSALVHKGFTKGDLGAHTKHTRGLKQHRKSLQLRQHRINKNRNKCGCRVEDGRGNKEDLRVNG
jgi:uncharacterized protein (UPF0210 family)